VSAGDCCEEARAEREVLCGADEGRKEQAREAKARQRAGRGRVERGPTPARPGLDSWQLGASPPDLQYPVECLTGK
jgi:hypothetical protein